MPFSLALSGINAANNDLNVTANNLANVDTTGFKSSRAEFASLFAQTQSGVSQTAIGNGVQTQEVAQQFSQGNINSTSNNLDLAISGSGFFVVKNNGATTYTRDGAFQIDQNGNLVNASGEQVQGYPYNSTNGTFNTGGLSNIQLSTGQVAPQATSTAGLTLNLPASATAPTAAFSPTNSSSYNDTTSLTVYDSLGAAHTAQLYFVKGAAANTWTANLYIDGNSVGSQALTYNSSGVLTSPTAPASFGSYTPSGTGAAPMNITFDLSKTTQFGDSFGVDAITQNGYTTGNLTGVSISSTGVIEANYTNGQSQTLGQIALANFANPQGLQQQGDTQWSQSYASGEPVLGSAGGSGFGSLQSGALESSNVNLTAQLVNMITAQRDFQANAQMIQAGNTVTQAILQIR